MAEITTADTTAVETFKKRTFWKKTKRLAGKLPFLPDVVAMYHSMMDPKTPAWAKVQIAGALLYFVSPLDLIPDPTPGVGYLDDAGVIITTLKIVHMHITDEHHAKARAFFDG